MVGSIIKEIDKKRKEKEFKDFRKKVEEIKKLYVLADIEVPLKTQLDSSKEVVEAYYEENKIPPSLALHKLSYKNKLGFFYLSLLTLWIVVTVKYYDFSKFEGLNFLLFLCILVFPSLIIVEQLIQYLLRNFDKRHLNNLN
jgi:hypothetical protein